MDWQQREQDIIEYGINRYTARKICNEEKEMIKEVLDQIDNAYRVDQIKQQYGIE